MHSTSRPPYERFARIDCALRSENWPTAVQLAEELEVHIRTIRRDLGFMRDRLSAPIAYNKKQRGYHYTDKQYSLPCLAVSEGEYLALFLAERLLQEYRGTPYAEGITRLFRKVTEWLPASTTIDLRHLSDAISFRLPGTETDNPRHFETLHAALRAKRQMTLVYYSASSDAVTRRKVNPYHLASSEGIWYLIAYCHNREKILLFSLNRIQELIETDEFFERPPDFNHKTYLDDALRIMRSSGPPQTVRLRFSAAVARFIREKTWHPTQTIEAHADGSLTLTFRVTHLLEAKRLALSYGADCEVLEPDCLKQEIIKELEEMIGRMKGNA